MKVKEGKNIRNDLTLECDVAVVGSGPAGAAASLEIAKAGGNVIVLEEGPYTTPDQFPPDGFSAMSRLYRDMGTSITRGLYPIPYLQGKVVGGTSVVNGAISWRLPKDVYDRWLESEPALAESMPWEKIERITDRVEEFLSIHPTEPEIAGPNNLLLAKGAEAIGLEHRPIRRNVSGCRGLGRCLQGCPEGHKQSMDLTYLPEAVKYGARIFSDIRVEKIRIRNNKVEGVRGRTAGGAEVDIMTRKGVVLAAGAVQSPELLIRSGITSGPVGRFFQAHPGVSVTGRFKESVSTWTGATQGHEVIGLRKEGLKFEAIGFDIAFAAARLKSVGRRLAEGIVDLPHMACWGAAVRAGAEGVVKPSGGKGVSVTYNPKKEDLRKIIKGIALLGKMMLAAGAEYVSPGVYGWKEKVKDPSEFERFEAEAPLSRKAYTMIMTHMFGTCRIGSDRTTSVVGPDFMHHKIKNLYIADSSVFPTNTGVNPQTSIIAVATICGELVAGNL